MNQRMPRCPSFDISQASEVSPFEIAVSMLEFPQRRFGRSCVEHIAHFVKAIHIQLSNKGGDIGVFEVLRQYLGEIGRWRHDKRFVVVGP